MLNLIPMMLFTDAAKTNIDIATDILSLLITVGLPLIIVAYAGMVNEHSGIINLGLEGEMLVGGLAGYLTLRAFTQVTGTNDGYITHNMNVCLTNVYLPVLVGVLVAMAAGAIYSLLLSFAAINLKADQTIVGTAMNILAGSLVILIAWAIQGPGMTNIDTPNWIRITGKNFGWSSMYYPISDITNPGAGDYFKYFFTRLFLKDFYLTTPIIIVILVAVAIFLKKTRTGLRLRACGENPQAADSVGISVAKMRYLGVTLSGLLSGLGGFALCLSIGYTGSVIGFGFLALAVMIFGNWKPGRIILAGVIFALFRVISNYSLILPKSTLSNTSYLYMTIPYVMTLIILVFFSKTTHAPKAEGIPYDKGAR
ncbi:MAG: ABC transporter permease [Bacilli bacterium]|jgi:ABC-type uncharacterized transport system permease subunit|nr:ABC transporter permease [Bacilli bacterium]